MITIFRDGDYPPLRRWEEHSQIVWFASFALILYFMTGLILSWVGIHNSMYQLFDGKDFFCNLLLFHYFYGLSLFSDILCTMAADYISSLVEKTSEYPDAICRVLVCIHSSEIWPGGSTPEIYGWLGFGGLFCILPERLLD